MRFYVAAVPFVALSLAGCQSKPAAAPSVTQADAMVAMESARRAWASMDAAKVDAVYADDAVSFVPESPGLVVGKDGLAKANADYVKLKYDTVTITDPHYQLLGPKVFVFSGKVKFASTDAPKNDGDTKVTEVFQQQDDGNWKIVTENVAPAPKAS